MPAAAKETFSETKRKVLVLLPLLLSKRCEPRQGLSQVPAARRLSLFNPRARTKGETLHYAIRVTHGTIFSRAPDHRCLPTNPACGVERLSSEPLPASAYTMAATVRKHLLMQETKQSKNKRRPSVSHLLITAMSSTKTVTHVRWHYSAHVHTHTHTFFNLPLLIKA